MPERFYVDRRNGCVAVRDRTLTDPEYPGLHEDTEGVVQFWMFPLVDKTCVTCGHRTTTWSDGELEYLEAKNLASQMNAATPAAPGAEEGKS